MDNAMIGKIEKARLYAGEPGRITFNTLSLQFQGDNNLYQMTLTPEGWDCSCPGFREHGMCPHIMTMERVLDPMLKRNPMPYAPGQNVVSDVEKAYRYAHELDRITILEFDVSFVGKNGAHNVTYQMGEWHCDCSFFETRGVCVHTMTMERVLGSMLRVPAGV